MPLGPIYPISSRDPLLLILLTVHRTLYSPGFLSVGPLRTSPPRGPSNRDRMLYCYGSERRGRGASPSLSSRQNP
ncbi:hypothetical protein SKAU_G00065730 [Synaphobranchus kaupii]|uniref:Uncharacterized protein n=1 Tax=Synaphobranchus kaupii TaxID=118154 RepID=A0A9Q1JAT6_SYNKA|nr:hypothetical protein SKAU_G00065730 [Synaphobranchus kaupii]